MPSIMVQQVNGEDEVHLAFGLKAKRCDPSRRRAEEETGGTTPGGGSQQAKPKAYAGYVVDFVCAAGFKSKGWFGGWNWQFSILHQDKPWYERIVRIRDMNDKFCFEAPIRRFNVVSGGWICEKQIANHSSAGPSYNRTTVVAKSMLIDALSWCVTETDDMCWCVTETDDMSWCVTETDD